MSILVCGINHKTASVAVREKLFFAFEKLPLYLNDLLGSGIAEEAMLLSTCNRSELYCKAKDQEAVKNWFCQQHGPTGEELAAALYLHEGAQAVEHLMKVACGLDSMVLGEPEILGQVKAAFSESCTAGAVGAFFHQLFQQVFAIAKEVRTTTAIGACPVSIASTTLNLAKRLLPDFSNARVLIIGAGDTAELILRYLKASPAKKVWLANRNPDKALSLAKIYNTESLALNEIASVLPQIDIMITATGSLEPIITQSFLKETLHATQESTLHIFDIAVPRDVEASAALLPAVKLYCIDDLKAIIQENQSTREHAAQKAREVIKQRSAAFMTQLHSQLQVSDTIRAYREQITAVCDSELEKALRQLENQQDPEKVLQSFAYAITNKLLHAPSVQLRQAGSEGRLDILRLAKQLLSIPEFDSKNL